MANKKNKRKNKNKNKNVAGAPPENPISDAPPQNPISNSSPSAIPSDETLIPNSPPLSPVPSEETIIPNIAEVEKEAIDFATAAFKKHRFDRDIAEQMKNEFDNRYGPTWHCIIGRDFGYFINHETNCYIRFQVGPKNVLLFKSG